MRQVLDVVHFAGRGGLAAAAGPPATEQLEANKKLARDYIDQDITAENDLVDGPARRDRYGQGQPAWRAG